MNDKYVVGPSPHIRSPRTVNYIMWDVVVALIPVMIASIIYYGMASIYILSLSTFTALFCEAIVLNKSISIRKFLGDGSAAVTGILLGLSLPPIIGIQIGDYWWAPILGSAVAILVGKHVFGGLGKNPFNPALVGRAFLTISFPVLMAGSWIKPGPEAVDAVTTATALAPGGMDFTLGQMFIGNIPGSLGETSAFAIIIGGIYLLYKGHIDWRIPGGFLGAMAVISIFHVGLTQGISLDFFQAAGNEVLFQWFAGTAMLGAVYMATCYVTSPTTKSGRLWYGMGCGLILILIRYYGQLPEGLTYAILFMNALTPIIDRYTIPRTFGEVKR